jgi:pimeloyl-ACP methyl ester carboxylesterase
MYPVLLLHGALGSNSQLLPLKTRLEESAFEVHSVNFSGHSGQPSLSEFGIQRFGKDVLEFLDDRRIPKVDIFGYSMGGYVAVWLAAIAPERVNKIATLGTKFDWSVESATNEVKKLNPEKILDKVPAFARILESRHAPNDWKVLMGRTAEMMLGLGETPLLTDDIFSKINQKILILLGDQDDMADRTFSERVATLLPQGQFRLMLDTPHPIEKVDHESLVSLLVDHFTR